MAHEIRTMAFTGEKCWHGLGFEMPANASIEEWNLIE